MFHNRISLWLQGRMAKIYTSGPNANPGALFIRFHVDGGARKAVGYLKTITGEVINEFEILANEH